jgi:hypothetical protein
MKQETLDKAKLIERRLKYIADVRSQWERERDYPVPYQELRSFVPEIGADPKEVAAPIKAFERACLDLLDTHEAALKAELEAL